jgi:hypothetical protein
MHFGEADIVISGGRPYFSQGCSLLARLVVSDWGFSGTSGSCVR